jgi:hypothetical protein
MEGWQKHVENVLLVAFAGVNEVVSAAHAGRQVAAQTLIISRQPTRNHAYIEEVRYLRKFSHR